MNWERYQKIAQISENKIEANEPEADESEEIESEEMEPVEKIKTTKKYIYFCDFIKYIVINIFKYFSLIS